MESEPILELSLPFSESSITNSMSLLRLLLRTITTVALTDGATIELPVLYYKRQMALQSRFRFGISTTDGAAVALPVFI